LVSGISNKEEHVILNSQPNPCTDFFILDIPNTFSSAPRLTLIDARGKVVLSKVVQVGKNRINIDRKLLSGVYYGFCFDNRNQKATCKIVVRKDS